MNHPSNTPKKRTTDGIRRRSSAALPEPILATPPETPAARRARPELREETLMETKKRRRGEDGEHRKEGRDRPGDGDAGRDIVESPWLKTYRSGASSDASFFRRQRQRISPPSGAGRKFAILGLVLIITIIPAFVALSARLARLTIIITPKMTAADIAPIIIIISTAGENASDTPPYIIPAELLTLTESTTKEFPSSGKSITSASATGTVRIFNQYSQSPQTLVKTTRFLAQDGTLYRLTRTITVTGAKLENGKLTASSAEAELAADRPGEEANKSGEMRLSIPGFKGTPREKGFYAVAPSGFAGGYRGDGAAVSREDTAEASRQITQEIFDAAKRKIQSAIPDGFMTVAGLDEIIITRVDVPADGTPAERFSVRADAEAKVLVFREMDLNRILDLAILKDDATREIMPKMDALVSAVRDRDLEKGSAQITLSGRIGIRTAVDADEIAQVARGKKLGTLKNIIRGRFDVENIELTLFPPWRITAPDDPTRIKVEIK